MAFDGGLRDSLAVGTVLTAKYKGAEYAARVIPGEEGKVRFQLPDGREFKSPSAAASAVMGGQAANGWRFWSVAAEEPAGDHEAGPETRQRGRRDAFRGSSEGAPAVPALREVVRRRRAAGAPRGERRSAVYAGLIPVSAPAGPLHGGLPRLRTDRRREGRT